MRLFVCAVDHGVNEGEPVDEQYREQESEDQYRDPEPEGQYLEQYQQQSFQNDITVTIRVENGNLNC